MKNFFLIPLLLFPLATFANEPVKKLDRAPIEKATDVVALQRGARTFVNYCLNCHSATMMRYNKLHDIGLTDQQIKDNLMFTAEKLGDTMDVSMSAQDAKDWFGTQPPDLSVIARVRGADWLYTYLRTFYRDDKRPTGWNNLVFDNVGMPHVLYQLQGQNALKVDVTTDPHGHKTSYAKLEQIKPGTLNKMEYDNLVGDLVAFLVYMSEPQAAERKQIGIAVLIVLGLLLALTYWLKNEYWKDVH